MILITGASSGLGAALASLYAKENEALTLTGRHAERLQTVANALTPFSNKTIAAIAADLAAGGIHLGQRTAETTVGLTDTDTDSGSTIDTITT